MLRKITKTFVRGEMYDQREMSMYFDIGSPKYCRHFVSLSDYREQCIKSFTVVWSGKLTKYEIEEAIFGESVPVKPYVRPKPHPYLREAVFMFIEGQEYQTNYIDEFDVFGEMVKKHFKARYSEKDITVYYVCTTTVQVNVSDGFYYIVLTYPTMKKVKRQKGPPMPTPKKGKAEFFTEWKK